MKTIVVFGEILSRLSPPGGQRIRAAVPGPLEVSFGGAEANVAASVALLGGAARIVSALPQHSLADAAVGHYAGLGVEVSQVLRREEGRMGLYFYENGAAQRPGEVVYDRENSTVSITPADCYPWDAIFHDAGMLYLTGITPGLSRVAAEATLVFAKEAKRRRVPVALDLNFRRKLWRWKAGVAPEVLARETLVPIIGLADLLLANDGVAWDLFSLSEEEGDDVSRSLSMARQFSKRFPNLSQIAMTLRESLSASHHRWGALLYTVENDAVAVAPERAGRYCPYEIMPVVDRVGAGDAFGAALVYALSTPELSPPHIALPFATAASCLAHSMPGDISYLSRSEVEALMNGDGSGRVIR